MDNIWLLLLLLNLIGFAGSDKHPILRGLNWLGIIISAIGLYKSW